MDQNERADIVHDGRITRRRMLFGAAGAVGAAALLAACGDDDDNASPATTGGASATTGAATATTGAATATTKGGSSTTSAGATGGPSAGSAGCPPIDDSTDATEGTGAGRFISDLTCAKDKPLKAQGEPVIIGFQNPEGDPNGSFPEYSLAAQAAVEYINNELGGLGADIQNGKPGRPIQLEVCKMAITPDDSQRCANELVSKKPFLIVSSLNFFGNQIPVYQQAKVPAIVGTPITIADFTSKGVYSIGGGGGCLGVHTGLVKYVTEDLEAKRVAVPWADTPPGVVCYYDLEKKPLDVLAGKVKGSSKDAGSIPDLQEIGVPVKPATPDVTPQVTQVLDFKPDGIIFSAQGADCWNFVDGLGRLGWTPDKIPLVLSTSCLDFDAMKAAGDLAKGIYFVGSANSVTQDPAAITNPRDKFEAEIYQSKPAQYGMPQADLLKGFAISGWGVMLDVWEQASALAANGTEVTPEAFDAAIAATDNTHAFGSAPLSCSTAPAPYVAVCNSLVRAQKWDGAALSTVKDDFSGIDLVAGTELKPGP
jgi:branched-chain amino acid transport system substrate-binding protein